MILVSKKRELNRGTELRMEHGDRFKSVPAFHLWNRHHIYFKFARARCNWVQANKIKGLV